MRLPGYDAWLTRGSDGPQEIEIACPHGCGNYLVEGDKHCEACGPYCTGCGAYDDELYKPGDWVMALEGDDPYCTRCILSELDAGEYAYALEKRFDWLEGRMSSPWEGSDSDWQVREFLEEEAERRAEPPDPW